ncbi:aldehyde dehydrogenase (NADP(+)) [Castellaniella daejeonensis]|jgi:NADP-dependent aldehyde dehydrogenase|uniref:Aldehyde dehydrogenase (NADP(+)) n=1 Tax=Castellaniella daejeonensis TaxID=659013 RepID=A0ABP3DIU1_9BURK|nr:aldehyde dehydrogenase (NADP(+)) [Castellaniella sp.]HET8703176.1 aldehyde dehydrogenase (NADP(+)) [Castellaniella sp.]
MQITGTQLIGSQDIPGTGAEFHAIDPATGEALAPAWRGADAGQVDRAARLAEAAFASYRETGLETRAAFLEAVAQSILDLGDTLIERAMRETGLPRARLEGERGRTVNQLRLFARVVRDGDWVGARIDHALPDRTPMPRSDIRLRHIPVGPVAVFGASNFPLAFSVAGGDTASALAAGAPVVVKAHPAHPGTSELVGRAIRKAIRQCGLHEGVFSLLAGPGHELSLALVGHPSIQAVGFTGSRQGGLALMRAAAARPVPIPVYAEMSSTNPVFLLPGALAARAEDIARGFVVSLTGSAGQLCTNPGLIIGLDGPDLDRFVRLASEGVGAAPAATMLTAGIARSYREGVERLHGHAGVQPLARGAAGEGPAPCQAGLAETTAKAFLAAPAELGAEVFGASALIVRCASAEDMAAVARSLEGQLTATLHLQAGTDDALVAELLPTLELKAGRILANGFPTGVEVCDAMVHGGPFPATSDPRTTSVGTLAITRFLRPVCYQDIPDGLLPPALQSDNPWGIARAER